ncbi:MAG: hypothetical protein PHN88_08800 [Ignavibacteria bacterium]|nr:hypothetical protein [Ignavibacteria bacterium]
MKYLISSFLMIISLSVLLPHNISANKIDKCNSVIRCLEWVEYVEIDGQWYEIIHQDDGTVIIVPVAAPIRD